MKVEIKYSPDAQTIVLLDEEDITDSLYGVTLTINSKQMASLQLDLVMQHGVTAKLKNPTVFIPEATKTALRLLGWTEPKAKP